MRCHGRTPRSLYGALGTAAAAAYVLGGLALGGAFVPRDGFLPHAPGPRAVHDHVSLDVEVVVTRRTLGRSLRGAADPRR
jgi:hypothetical protein